MDGTSVVWELIKDNFEQARSHEEYREKTVTLTMTIASIFLAALAIDGFASRTITVAGVEITFQRLDGLCLIIIGLFGALCSQKHYERNRMHIALAQEYLSKLQAANAVQLPFDVVAAFKEFAAKKTWKAAWAERIKLNLLWTAFPLIISAIGFLISI
jgi:hypothetical protein